MHIYLFRLHLQKTPPYIFINRLKIERFSVFWKWGGRFFHILGPTILKLFLRNFTSLGPKSSKSRFYWLQLGLPEVLNPKILDMKLGFNCLRFFNRVTECYHFWMVIVDCLTFLKDIDSHFHNHPLKELKGFQFSVFSIFCDDMRLLKFHISVQ